MGYRNTGFPLISVIVPVYRVESYIRRCIDSILAQTYSNLDIILVDDGSPDSCGQICDEYAQKDNRITVIHKKNGGLSDARNAALEIMQGNFVTFVDSDDYIAPNYIAQLYTVIQENHADISVCAEAFVEEKEDGIVYPLKRPLRDLVGTIVMTAEDALSCMLRQDLFDASAWAKLYHSKLFDGVRYPVGYAYEDVGTTHKLFLKSKIVAFGGDHLYFYVQRIGSILHTNSSIKRYWDGIHMAESQKENVLHQWPQLESAVNSRCISMYFHALMGADHLKDERLTEYAWTRITQLRVSIIKDKRARSKARMAALLSYTGKKCFLFVWNVLLKKH